jgi:hypothetical protein
VPLAVVFGGAIAVGAVVGGIVGGFTFLPLFIGGCVGGAPAWLGKVAYIRYRGNPPKR